MSRKSASPGPNPRPVRVVNLDRPLQWFVQVLAGLAIVVSGFVIYQIWTITDLHFIAAPAPPVLESEIAEGPRWRPGMAVAVVTLVPPTPQPGATQFVEQPGASLPPAQPQPIGYDPQQLSFSSRPQFPSQLDPRDQAFLDWVNAGNLKYTPWQWLKYHTGPDQYVLSLVAESLICAASIEQMGGSPANDLLAKLATEGNAGEYGPFQSSDVGAQGPMQIRPGTFGTYASYPGANVQEFCDAMAAASNLMWHRKIFATMWPESRYVWNFGGGSLKADGTFDEWCHSYAWNCHKEQAMATYRLSNQIAEARARFWQVVPEVVNPTPNSTQEVNP